MPIDFCLSLGKYFDNLVFCVLHLFEQIETLSYHGSDLEIWWNLWGALLFSLLLVVSLPVLLAMPMPHWRRVSQPYQTCGMMCLLPASPPCPGLPHGWPVQRCPMVWSCLLHLAMGGRVPTHVLAGLLYSTRRWALSRGQLWMPSWEIALGSVSIAKH